jgi:hypothetical protein
VRCPWPLADGSLLEGAPRPIPLTMVSECAPTLIGQLGFEH